MAPSRGLPEGAQALAIFAVNRRGAGTKGCRDEQMFFQVEMEVEHAGGIVARPNVADEDSDQWDQKVADLQFRDRVGVRGRPRRRRRGAPRKEPGHPREDDLVA